MQWGGGGGRGFGIDSLIAAERRGISTRNQCTFIVDGEKKIHNKWQISWGKKGKRNIAKWGREKSVREFWNGITAMWNGWRERKENTKVIHKQWIL